MKKPEIFRRKSKGEIALHIFVSFIFLLVAFSYLYLVIWAVLAGFKTHTEVVMNPFGLPTIWHWGNYLEVFKVLSVNSNNFFDMLFNSVYFSVLGSGINMFVSMTFAYCCTKYKFPGSNLPYLIILVMITLPLYGTGGATYRIYKSLGLINSYAQIVCAIGGFSAGFLYYRAYYQNVSWSYAEAAMMDGADHFKIYSKVMFPLGKPLFVAFFIQSWLGAWNSYENEMVYRPELATLPLGIYQFNTEMIYRARLDILFAACVIISIPAIVLFTVFNKTLTTSVSLGGLKG